MRWIILVSVGLLVLVGCGPRGATKGGVTGTITYKGQPVNGASLSLYPASGGESVLTIPVSQEGTFSTTDVPAGDYKVVVQGSAAASGSSGGQFAAKPTIPFPPKYKDPQKTDITMKVSPGSGNVTLEMKD
jgi:hypothetical protein